MGDAVIDGTVTATGAAGLSVGRLVVEENTTVALAFPREGLFVTYQRLEVSRRVLVASDSDYVQYFGTFQLQTYPFLHRHTFQLCTSDKANSPPGFICPSGGTLGTVLVPTECPPDLPCDCPASQTCDTAFGLCRGAPFFSNPNLTLPTTAAATDAWVIAVAVAVPAAVLLGVAAALLVVYLHRRNTASYDLTANAALKESNLAAIRTYA